MPCKEGRSTEREEDDNWQELYWIIDQPFFEEIGIDCFLIEVLQFIYFFCMGHDVPLTQWFSTQQL